MKRQVALCLFLTLFAAATPAEQQFPDGPGKDTLKRVCAGCHGPEIVFGRAQTREEWSQIIIEMATGGAQGSVDEFGEIVDYLTKYFPKQINVNKAPADQLAAVLELPVKDAEALVRYREQNGAFKSIEDLKKVPDLDVRKVEAKKDRLVF